MTKFVSDCSCDLHSIQGVNFTAVPLTISSDRFHFTDDENLDIHFFLDTLDCFYERIRWQAIRGVPTPPAPVWRTG